MSNNIKHHLTDALLTAYAAGTLPEAFDLVVATHISMCDECRARLAEFEALGGEVLEQMATDEAALDEGSLAATMALIADESAAQPAARPVKAGSVFPGPLQAYAGADLDEVKWRRVGGGVSQKVLKTRGDATVRLLRIPAGSKMPDHGHRGTELTLVLSGAFMDEDDIFAAGDIEVANEELHHTPIAAEGEDCICLAATDAPLRFKGLMPRIAQRMIGI